MKITGIQSDFDTDNLITESIINEVGRIGVKAASIICDMSRDGIYRVADKVCFFRKLFLNH